MTNPDLQGARREESALAPDQARPNAAPAPWQAAPAPAGAQRHAPGRAGLSADPGCYEIRFRLAGWEALGPPFGLLFLGAGIFSDPFSMVQVTLIAIGGFLTVPYVILLARRAIVFRADQTGITFGPEVLMRQFFSEFIPWADIKKITFYKIARARTPWQPPGRDQGTYIGVVPHPRTQADGAARRINAWRLDRERLAAVTAATAPGVAIIDAGEIDPHTNAGRAVLRQVGR